MKGMTCVPPPGAVITMVSLSVSRMVFTNARRKNRLAMGRNLRRGGWGGTLSSLAGGVLQRSPHPMPQPGGRTADAAQKDPMPGPKPSETVQANTHFAQKSRWSSQLRDGCAWRS